MKNCTTGSTGPRRSGNSFLKVTAEAALLADLKHYDLLRPVLLELKKEWPKPPMAF
jgi:hypothetical protein